MLRYCEIGAPKSESSRRTVPIEPEILLPALKAWKLVAAISASEHSASASRVTAVPRRSWKVSPVIFAS
jgi:hypothetical protein